MADRTQKTKSRRTILRLTESAIMLALAVVLGLFKPIQLPYGGGVTLFSMLPIILVSYRYGNGWGTLISLAYGVIKLLMGLDNAAWIAKTFSAWAIFILFDYILAFGVLGLGGMFRKVIKRQTLSLALGGAVVGLLRLACHFVSGATIWATYAADSLDAFRGYGFDRIITLLLGTDPSPGRIAAAYSFIYNASYMIPEIIITVIGCVIIAGAFSIGKTQLKAKQ